MAEVKGMGSCLIPNKQGIPCGNQIEEGEPIGTVMLPGGPVVGHKRCSNSFYARKQQSERERMNDMVKIAKQGAGGVVGPYEDAVIGSTPLVPPEVDGKPVLAHDPDTGVNLASRIKAAEPALELTETERQQILAARAATTPSVAELARQRSDEFVTAANSFRSSVADLAQAYDKMVAERDQARSERDSARAAASTS